jgi:hypothetical protein
MNKRIEAYEKKCEITFTVKVLLAKSGGEFENDIEYSVIDTVTSSRGLDHIHKLLTPKYATDKVRYRGFEWTDTNTLEKFLKATGFDRNKNYPSVHLLKRAMKKLMVNEDLEIDIMSFFLYDHESE